uniref:Uncharacterized protein n=1 Tax=Oryza sativa subsp. japonica TaxID=39947 RepID=Q651J0_ORYSJ|nr:hypothetical protein [Oryza sativa Japonica Group]
MPSARKNKTPKKNEISKKKNNPRLGHRRRSRLVVVIAGVAACLVIIISSGGAASRRPPATNLWRGEGGRPPDPCGDGRGPPVVTCPPAGSHRRRGGEGRGGATATCRRSPARWICLPCAPVAAGEEGEGRGRGGAAGRPSRLRLLPPSSPSSHLWRRQKKKVRERGK